MKIFFLHILFSLVFISFKPEVWDLFYHLRSKINHLSIYIGRTGCGFCFKCCGFRCVLCAHANLRMRFIILLCINTCRLLLLLFEMLISVFCSCFKTNICHCFVLACFTIIDFVFTC